MEFEILQHNLLKTYCETVGKTVLEQYLSLKDSDLSIDDFSFYTSVSAVFSSKIEGDNIDLDSYIKHKRFAIEFLPDYTRKIDDLYNAYQFAKSAQYNEKNIAAAHKLFSTNILQEHKQGTIRTSNMYVLAADGRIEYVATSPFALADELTRLYKDLSYLLKKQLTIQEIFYYAALLHLVFVKIHPFNAGNGRTARLIEKWFLAEKLGEKAWFIQSEKYYYNNHQTYYNNIRRLGIEYEELDYSKSLPFLLMLPESLNYNS
jgi:Fic family protein